jgi:hypothetical protein
MTDKPLPDGEAAAETPAEAVARLAAELDGVQGRGVGKATEYARAGVVFAMVEPELLSFHLRAEIVDAALNTPNTARSARGAEWISLAPVAPDKFTVDRAAAWFESAWRLAASTSEVSRPH